MTERNIATMVERVLGDCAPYLHDVVVRLIAGRVMSASPARAIVFSLESQQSRVWGVCHHFTTPRRTEVYA
jgi:hypothetical protein